MRVAKYDVISNSIVNNYSNRMRIIAICLIFNFQSLFSFAQENVLYNQIDSTFRSIKLSDTDWAIALSIEQAGIILVHDSLGNRLDNNPTGTFLLLSINKSYYLQKFWTDYSNDQAQYLIGARFKLNYPIQFACSIDSISIAEKERTYQYIYKLDSLNLYIQLEPADHEPRYCMYFIHPKLHPFSRSFTETDFTELKFFLKFKNLNYHYNINTIIYRLFLRLNSLIKSQIKFVPSK